MQAIAVTLSISIILGIIFILYSAFFMKKTKERFNPVVEGTSASAVEERIQKSVDEADDALLQLNNISGQILEEVEGKYKELLFLYQMVEDKKNEIVNISTKAKEPEVSPLKEEDEIQEQKPAEQTDEADFEPSEGTYVKPAAPSSTNHKKEKPDTIHEKSKKQKNYKDILRYYENGMSIAEIAKMTDTGKGEIQFIIEINKGRREDG